MIKFHDTYRQARVEALDQWIAGFPSPSCYFFADTAQERTADLNRTSISTI